MLCFQGVRSLKYTTLSNYFRIHSFQVTANNSCGSEARIRYKLSEKGPRKELFHVDDQSGTVCLEKALDYEQSTIYQLHVFAQDTS